MLVVLWLTKRYPFSFRWKRSRLYMEQWRDSRRDDSEEGRRLGLNDFVRFSFFRSLELLSRRQLESRGRAQHTVTDGDALDPINGLMSFRREYDICIISLSSRVMYLMVACRWFLSPSVIPKSRLFFSAYLFYAAAVSVASSGEESTMQLLALMKWKRKTVDNHM
ncbi:hypothetical protein F2Q70_00003453 [Brassica cretica]|uniref:Uncharacterized protein n=1 Tax=Brassica cretica TaxID=69181 RepID=A0A8S9J2W6_BRACR|nr:hypothetical protein F2Q70_00003453 [Brassica cretica]